jgi:phosphoglycolate phosphatase-like HAD superfamily hydrolase
MSAPVLALDFDGVLCDSAIETALTGWQVGRQVWSDMPSLAPEPLVELFKQVRPVMETGYEAIIIMRALFEGQTPQQLLANFSKQMSHFVRRDLLDSEQLKVQFGETRDQWIEKDLDSWITMNPLFKGVTAKLQQLQPETSYIITTKQERFVSQILANNDVSFPDEHIFGLDRNLSKQQVLRDLLFKHPDSDILFIEDRLPTLFNVMNDERLTKIKLFFADWGYNTQEDKKTAKQVELITTLSLAEMLAI